ncbi:MAG: alanine racemase, partial [Bacteroidetes bacterium]|nr:alanine racemase [Bacteroidota bacterium]
MLHPDIHTPTLLLDESVARRNIERMCSKAERHGLRFRPHFKTHQSRRVGEWFRDEGVRAITVSSVRMARYFADDGWDDITIAFPVNLREAVDIRLLAARVSLGVLVEAPLVAHRLDALLDSELRTWIKVDTGHGRTGIPAGDTESLVATARAVAASRHLKLEGLLTHGG